MSTVSGRLVLMRHVARRATEDEVRDFARIAHPAAHLVLDITVRDGKVVDLPPGARLLCQLAVAVMTAPMAVLPYFFLDFFCPLGAPRHGCQ